MALPGAAIPDREITETTTVGRAILDAVSATHDSLRDGEITYQTAHTIALQLASIGAVLRYAPDPEESSNE